MSGCICTQIGPTEYARTPVIVYQVGPPDPGISSGLAFKLGTTQYSSAPCETGNQVGDVSASPTPVVSTNCPGGQGASFPLADVTVYGFDPACGLFFGGVTLGSCSSFFVWASAPNAPSWTSVPPERTSSAVFDLYQFPLKNGVPKWVAVGDGIFKSHDFGATWSKIQDWSTTPFNLFYASQTVLVGFLQVDTIGQVVTSTDDGATWTVAASYPGVYFSPDPSTASPFAPLTNANNYYGNPPDLAIVQIPTGNVSSYSTGKGYGVVKDNPQVCGLLMQPYSNPAAQVVSFLAFSVEIDGISPLGFVDSTPVLGKFYTSLNGAVSQAASPVWSIT